MKADVSDVHFRGWTHEGRTQEIDVSPQVCLHVESITEKEPEDISGLRASALGQVKSKA